MTKIRVLLLDIYGKEEVMEEDARVSSIAT